MRAVVLASKPGGRASRRHVRLRPWIEVRSRDALGSGLEVACLRCAYVMSLERMAQAQAEECLGTFGLRHAECE